MENQEHLERLVNRYLNDQTTPDELAVFVHLHRQGLLDTILNAHLDGKISLDEKQQKSWSSPRLAGMAAMIALLIMSGYLIYFNRYFLQEYFNPAAIIQVTTGNREIKKITLSDGSVITLNRNSSVSFKERWGNKDREVSFSKGEAYFQIKKTADNKTFTVKTQNGLDIKVLGTEFNVSNKSKEVSVYLKKGKVLLHTPKKQAILAPGDLAAYSSVQESLDVHQDDGDRSLAWKNNLFVFEDAGLTEVVQELEDFYGIKIQLRIKKADQLRFTGKISRTNMTTVMNVLAETLNLKIKHKGRIITFQTLK